MRRVMLSLIAALALYAGAQAVTPDERLQDPALEARARAISKELRCLVCQNQSIDDSDADVAADLRRLVRQRLLAGDSNAEVKEYVVARYGEFALLKPRVGAHTALLWAAPLVLTVLGVFIGVLVFRGGAQATIEDLDAEQDN